MAKTKNASQHNEAAKAHRNGIKRIQKTRYTSTKGCEPKFLRNQRYAKKNNKPLLQKKKAKEFAAAAAAKA